MESLLEMQMASQPEQIKLRFSRMEQILLTLEVAGKMRRLVQLRQPQCRGQG